MDMVAAYEIEKAEAEKMIGLSFNDDCYDFMTDGRFVRYFNGAEEAIYEVDTEMKEWRHTIEYLGCGWTDWEPMN